MKAFYREIIISSLLTAAKWFLFIYLLIFNLFIVEKFISITTRIAFYKQQELSQTLGAINKIAECWYHWYQTFEIKSPFIVLTKVNPKQKRKKKEKKNTAYATNWKLTLYHNELIKTHKTIINVSIRQLDTKENTSKIWINTTNTGNKKKLNKWTKS